MHWKIHTSILEFRSLNWPTSHHTVIPISSIYTSIAGANPLQTGASMVVIIWDVTGENGIGKWRQARQYNKINALAFSFSFSLTHTLFLELISSVTIYRYMTVYLSIYLSASHLWWKQRLYFLENIIHIYLRLVSVCFLNKALNLIDRHVFLRTNRLWQW